jgi:hypothetical protein
MASPPAPPLGTLGCHNSGGVLHPPCRAGTRGRPRHGGEASAPLVPLERGTTATTHCTAIGNGFPASRPGYPLGAAQRLGAAPGTQPRVFFQGQRFAENLSEEPDSAGV